MMQLYYHHLFLFLFLQSLDLLSTHIIRHFLDTLLFTKETLTLTSFKHYEYKDYLSCKYFAMSINDVANLACSQSEAESGESQNTNPSLNMISATSFRCLSFMKRLPA